MTRSEALKTVKQAFDEIYPEMTAEETCDVLEKVCEILEWVLRDMPEGK